MTRFAKLALLLIVAGALALAGCGGDDNGLSAEDQARISAAEDAAAMAQAEAEAAEAAQAAADAEIAAAKEAADAAKAAADAAKAEADAAKMAADAAQAEAEAAKMAAEADDDVMAAADTVWEQIFGPVVEDEFKALVGETPTIAEIRQAILRLAEQYGDEPPSTPAGLDAELVAYFGTSTPTQERAVGYFKSLRAAPDRDYLTADRNRALNISPPADALSDAVASLTAAVQKLTDAEAAKKAADEKIAADTEAERQRMAEEQKAEDDEAAARQELVEIITGVLEQTGLTRIAQERADEDAQAEDDAEAERRRMEAEQELEALKAQLTDLGVPTGTVVRVFERVAGPEILKDFETRVTSSMSRSQVKAAIMATAAVFGLDTTGVDAYVDSLYPSETFDIRGDRVVADFTAMRATGRYLIATLRAHNVAVARDSGITMAGTPDPDPEPPEPPEPDMTKVEYIDTILGMDNLDEIVMEHDDSDLGRSSTFGTEHFSHTGGLVEDSIDDAPNGKEIYLFQANPGSAFADSGELMKLYGGWMKYGYFGSLYELAGAGRFSAFSFGMKTAGRGDIDGPSGGGTAKWQGSFVGHHNIDGSNHEVTGDAPADVKLGDMVSGEVELAVTFVKDEGASTLVATFEEFSSEYLDNVEIMFSNVGIGRGASFEADHEDMWNDDGDDGTTPLVSVMSGLVNNTDIADTDLEGSIEGQFYGAAGAEAGGVVKLMNGGTAAAGNPVFTITGAFGAENR